MLLAYRETPSFYAVGRVIGVTHQTVERCLRRAERLGVMAAMTARSRDANRPSPTRRGPALSIWPAARPRTSAIRTTRLLAKHIPEHRPAAGHTCLTKLAQGTLCK